MRNHLNTLKKLVTLFFCLWLGGCVSAGFLALNAGKITDAYIVHTIAYGEEALQQLDIYQPSDTSPTPRDVVFFLYGGGWETGQKKDYEFVAAQLVKRGFIVVIPDYRKYPEVRFPTFVEDAAKALAWTDTHISDYGGRAHFIHLLGHSAGAHIAALLTTDGRYLAQSGKKVRNVIADFAGLAGPYDFTPKEKDYIAIFGPPSRYPQMQATTFVTGHEPPMLLLYGLQDNVVESYNRDRLVRRIEQKNGRVHTLTYPELGHIGIITTFSGIGPDSSVVKDITSFFRELHE